MTLRLVLQREVEEDIQRARLWYDEQQPGLGTEFLRSIEATFARIQRGPELYALIDEEVRRAPVQRFPFAPCTTRSNRIES